MASCESCGSYLTPTSVGPDRRCPRCGSEAVITDGDPVGSDAGSRTPWHFVVLVSLVALYLGWRLIQAVVWLARTLG
ncbi:MAG TPA: hypothetical protein ENI86_02740 [Acidimicrobiales bacterium]|nr:hypothetical protein [Acidimicrobiales bacterium]